MNIRKIALVGVLCVSPFAAMAQSTGDSTGGSAGDGNRPTSYTRQDFESLDKNKDGIVDKKELVGSKLEPALVKKIDTNGDGQISQAEFDAYQASTEGNKVPKK